MKTVLIDIDETLVYVCGPGTGRHAPEEFKKDATSVEWEGLASYVQVRPSAFEFLQSLLDKGYQLKAITQGVVPWQARVFEDMKLDKYIPTSEIYGWEDLNRSSVKKPDLNTLGKWIVVDNHPMRGMLSGQKAMWLQSYFDSTNYIVCPEWEGGPDDKPLTDLIPAIDKLLN